MGAWCCGWFWSLSIKKSVRAMRWVVLLLVGVAWIGPVAAVCPFNCFNHGFCTNKSLEHCDCWDPWKNDALCQTRT